MFAKASKTKTTATSKTDVPAAVVSVPAATPLAVAARAETVAREITAALTPSAAKPAVEAKPIEAKTAEVKAVEAKPVAAAVPVAAPKPASDDVAHSLLNDLKSSNSTVRANAALKLEQLPNGKAENLDLNRVVTALIAALSDADADVARNAATSLGAVGGAAAVEPLIAALRNTNGYFHSVVRAAASASLGKLRDPRAFEPLVNAISDTSVE